MRENEEKMDRKREREGSNKERKNSERAFPVKFLRKKNSRGNGQKIKKNFLKKKTQEKRKKKKEKDEN